MVQIYHCDKFADIFVWQILLTRNLLSSNLLRTRATLHTRLRARDHYTPNTLIGGKGKAGPSLLHTMLNGPTENVNARWM